MADDTWAGLADLFADAAYASVKGQVRTYVLHHHLLEHLPEPPGAVLDVGGGAGHQSFPLAMAGYDITVLDSDDAGQVAATAAVELEASRRDPYRQLSRVFHLIGRRRFPQVD